MSSQPGGRRDSIPRQWGHGFEETAGYCHRRALAQVNNLMSFATRKRSYRRAVQRALRDGTSRYKGKLLTRSSLLRQGYASIGSDHQKSNVSQPSSRTKPGEKSRAPRLNTFSWNCGGLSSDKYDSLVVYLYENQIDVATIQETRWGFTSEWVVSGFYCIHSGLQDNSTKRSGQAGGVLTMVRTKLSPPSKLRWCSQVAGRILQVRFPYRDYHVDIINVYQRFCPENASETVREDVHTNWLELDKLLCTVPKRNVLYIAGDFNVRVSPMDKQVGPCFGRANVGCAQNDEVMAIIFKHQLCLLNTWAAATEFTCIGPGPGAARSVIDYVAVRLPAADDRAKRVLFHHDCPLLYGMHTYHVPLCASINMFWQCWRFGAALSEVWRSQSWSV